MDERQIQGFKQFITDHLLQDNPQSYYENIVHNWWNMNPRPPYYEIVKYMNIVDSVGVAMIRANELDSEEANAVAKGHQMLVNVLKRVESAWIQYDRQRAAQRRPDWRTCYKCNGSRVQDCWRCSGSGQVPGYQYNRPTFLNISCPVCSGSGQLNCSICGGTGRVRN